MTEQHDGRRSFTFRSYLDNRRAWGSGPWEGEPDKVEWVDMASLYYCVALRNPDSGAWLGYVRVPAHHALNGVEYDRLPGIEAHGGLTFSGPGSTHMDAISHSARDDNETSWFFGFDCAHSFDCIPDKRLRWHDIDRYNTIEQVQQEVTQLAAQLYARRHLPPLDEHEPTEED